MEKKKITVKHVPKEAVTSIRIDGSFYHRLSKLFNDYGTAVPGQKLIKSLIDIQKETQNQDPFTYNLGTLLILLNGIEKAFEKEGLTEPNEIEVEVDSHKRGDTEDLNDIPH